jgi:hypothetical protein
LATETEPVALHLSINIDNTVAIINAVRSEVELKHRAQESDRAARVHQYCASVHLKAVRTTRVNPVANLQLLRSFTRTSAWFQAKSDDRMVPLLQLPTSTAPPQKAAEFDAIVQSETAKVAFSNAAIAPPRTEA